MDPIQVKFYYFLVDFGMEPGHYISLGNLFVDSGPELGHYISLGMFFGGFWARTIIILD